jgi:hypothetical protein
MSMPKTITFNGDHDAFKGEHNCQVFIGLTGTKEEIQKSLREIADQIDRPYGKPIQGINIKFHVTEEVITPVWKGKNF